MGTFDKDPAGSEGNGRAIAEPTWDDVINAVGREMWKLAPQDYRDSGHKDLVFGVCWQNLMEAVETAVDSVIGPTIHD